MIFTSHKLYFSSFFLYTKYDRILDKLGGSMNKELKEKILNILQEEIVPAEGCTEPIAIAYAAAKLAQVLGEKAENIDIYDNFFFTDMGTRRVDGIPSST